MNSITFYEYVKNYSKSPSYFKNNFTRFEIYINNKLYFDINNNEKHNFNIENAKDFYLGVTKFIACGKNTFVRIDFKKDECKLENIECFVFTESNLENLPLFNDKCKQIFIGKNMELSEKILKPKY